MEEKRLDRFKQLESDLEVSKRNADKLRKGRLQLKKERDDAQENTRSFQGALDVRTRERY